jgi:hypothetical protein
MNTIATTDDLVLEYVGCGSIEELEREIEEFNSRPAFMNIYGPLLRARLIEDEWGYSIYGDVLIPEHDRVPGSVEAVERNIRFGYFELDQGELKGRRTITTEWAREYFQAFGKHFEKRNQLSELPTQEKRRSAKVYSELSRPKKSKRGLRNDAVTDATLVIEEVKAPWLLIPDHGWDRRFIKLWCDGFPDTGICVILQREKVLTSPKALTNRRYELRKNYPEARIPTNEERKRHRRYIE